MKTDILEDSAAEYETCFEILPKNATPIIVTGKAKGIRDVEDKKILKELKKIRGIYKDGYLFSWENVPGDDSDRLLRFLKDDFYIGWAENAEISKHDDGKTIHISKDKNSAKIIIDEKKKEGTLNISDGETYDLKVKKENGQLNIYTKEKELAFCLYKAGFKAFLDNSFIYYEHYIADYNLSSAEIIKRLQRKKRLTEEHLTDLLSSLNKELLVKMTFLTLFKLNQTKQQEIERTLIEKGVDIIQDRQTLMGRCADYYNRINFDIYLYNKDICVTSLCNWKDCHSGMTSFIHSVKGVLPNPYIDDEKELVEKAHDNFLERCNIVSVDVLREQYKTILKRLMLPIHTIVIPLVLLALYIGLSTKNILGMCGGIGICLLILGTFYWLKRSSSSEM